MLFIILFTFLFSTLLAELCNKIIAEILPELVYSKTILQNRWILTFQNLSWWENLIQMKTMLNSADEIKSPESGCMKEGCL